MKNQVYFFDNKGHYERVKAVPALPFFFLLLLGSLVGSDNSLKTIFLTLILASALFFAIPFYSNGKIEFRDQNVFFYRNGQLIGRYDFEDINEIIPDFSEQYNAYILTFRCRDGQEMKIYIDRFLLRSKRRMMYKLLGFLETNNELESKINVDDTVFLRREKD